MTHPTPATAPAADDWVPIARFPDTGRPWPTEDGLRMMYRDRAQNGLTDAFIKHGRLVLVSPRRLFALIEARGQAA